jgi:hypothetical protein
MIHDVKVGFVGAIAGIAHEEIRAAQFFRARMYIFFRFLAQKRDRQGMKDQCITR